MSRRNGWLGVPLGCVLALAACHPAPAARGDQSTRFFPATVGTYGLDLTQTDRDHLAELYALRQINPCGFVDRRPAALRDHGDYTYADTADQSVEPGFRGSIFPLGAEGCRIIFPDKETGLLLRTLPGEARWNDDQFSPAHPGVQKSTSWGKCVFRVTLPLTTLAGAPKAMRDPVLQVTPMDIADNTPDLTDTSLCPLTEALTAEIAAAVGEAGIPVHTGADRFLTADPCAAAPDLQAVGFAWLEPPTQAQFPTTWRHPGVCNLRRDGTASRSAVVKYGLVTWSDTVLEVPWGEAPVRNEQDGVTLFDFTTENETTCGTTVVAQTVIAIDPVRVGSGAPAVTPPTPVVVVRLSTAAGQHCADIAKRAALAAVKRAT